MTMISLKRKKQELLASKVSNLVSDTNENLLRVNLSKFFTDLEAEIQKALIEYWSDTLLLQGQLNLILAPIHEKHQEYYELIMHHKLQEFKRAKQSANRIVKREQKRVAMKSAKPVKFTANRNNLFGTLKYSEDRLANNTFTATENTLNRVDSNINQILTDGYRSGAGINEVGRQITERFDQLRTWEANRIARTEIHTAQNMGIMSSYESLGVEYTQWITTHDSRVRGLKKGDRADHVKMDREIIPFGGTYSNGLSFPGDTSGPIEEWINCRCSNAPFVMPAGMMAPSFSPFKESDLVPIPVVEEPQTIDPSQMENLSNQLPIEELNKMTFKELADHHEVKYDGLMKWVDGKEYHVFREKLDNGNQFRCFMEKGAVNSYKKGGVAHPNEIINEVFNVPKVYREETNQIWFKNTQQGIQLKPNGKFDTLGQGVGGYNKHRSNSLRGETVRGKKMDDPDHRIVINPKNFKKVSDFDAITWRNAEGEATQWKHVIHHEFIHSIDVSRKIWNNGESSLSSREEYTKIEQEEPHFTKYSNTQIGESFAEHGGYISYMEANPSEQTKTIRTHRYGRDENGKIKSFEEDITYEQYKKRYPKHYNYFKNLMKNGVL